MRRFCSSCGKEIKKNALYCSYCGNKQKEEIKMNATDKVCAVNEYDNKRFSNKRKIILLIVLLAIFVTMIVVILRATGMSGSEVLNDKPEIDLDTYSSYEVERLLEEFPYQLEEVQDKEVRSYVNDSEEIIVVLNRAKLRIESVTITGKYPKIKVHGLHTGMTLDEAKAHAMEKNFLFLSETENTIAVETPNSTSLIWITEKTLDDTEVCQITIEYGETMDAVEKRTKNVIYIDQVKKFTSTSVNRSYGELFDIIDGNDGKWECSLAMGKLYSENKVAYVSYTAGEKEICWSIGKDDKVNLVSAKIGEEVLESSKELEKCLVEGAGIIEDLIIGIWHNGETMWATNYHTIFYSDGTVEHLGYRNKDVGYYKFVNDYTIEVTFDEYVQWAGENYEYLGTYIAYFTYDVDSGTLDRRVGQRTYYSDYNNDFDNRTLVRVDKMVEDSDYY